MNFINERREMRGQSGFTLIELLVVIAILGILAAVVVFAVGGIGDKGKLSACKIDGRTLKTAEQAFVAQEPNGNFTDGAGLVTAQLLDQYTTNYHTIAPNVASAVAGNPVTEPIGTIAAWQGNLYTQTPTYPLSATAPAGC